ncbi:MAG: discoidin domain-containing protein [Bacillota bacterium]|nr:discoidin domain-containing protein [Bacillota bacterium]
MKKIFAFTLVLCLVLSCISVPFQALAQEADEISDKGAWTITASSEISPVTKVIDGDINTFWHTSYKAEGSTITSQDKPPYEIVLDLGTVTEISGLRLYPRPAGNSVAGTILKAEILGSTDGNTFTTLGDATYEYNPGLTDREGRTTKFSGNVKLKAVKIIVKEGRGDFGTLAELAVLKADKNLKAEPLGTVKVASVSKLGAAVSAPQTTPTQTATTATDPKANAEGNGASFSPTETVKPLGANEIEMGTDWVISVNSSMGAQAVTKAFDGKMDTIWHSFYTAEGTTITTKDKPPFEFIFKMPREQKVSGIRYYVRQEGSTSGIALELTVYGSLDGTNYTEICKDTYTYNAGYSDRQARTTKFPAEGTYKAIKVVFTKTVSDFGTCSELRLLSGVISDNAALPSSAATTVTVNSSSASANKTKTESPKIAANAVYEEDEIPSTAQWVASSDSCATSPASAIDGDKATFWHSYYEAQGGQITYHDSNPFKFIIKLPEETTISGIRYYPRDKSTSFTGIFKQVNVYVSGDGENYKLASANDTYYYGSTSPTTLQREACASTFGSNVKVKAVMIEVADSWSNYAVASEIRLLKPSTGLPQTLTADEYAAQYDDLTLVPIDRKDVTVTASSEQPYPFPNENDLNTTAIKTIDADTGSIWHTQYRNEDGSTEGFNKRVMPAYLQYDLGKVYNLSGIGYLPRGGGFRSGHWVEFSVSTSLDGQKFDIVDVFTLNKTQYQGFDYGEYRFYKPVDARYVRIDITSTTADDGTIANAHATAADINFFQTKKVHDQVLQDNKEVYTLKVGAPGINVSKSNNTYAKTLDVSPFIVNGTTMLPLRGLFEEMGATVTWNADNKKIEVVKGSLKIEFQIENNRVWVNGIRYTCTVAPRIVGGRTFIPLRFVSEHMGYSVGWEGSTQTINIQN